MGKKSELRLITQIEVTAMSNLISKEKKKEIIYKNYDLLKKYGYTKSWWYRNELPIILKRVDLKK